MLIISLIVSFICHAQYNKHKVWDLGCSN